MFGEPHMVESELIGEYRLVDRGVVHVGHRHAGIRGAATVVHHPKTQWQSCLVWIHRNRLLGELGVGPPWEIIRQIRGWLERVVRVTLLEE